MTPNPPEDEARALWVAIIVECPECPDAVGAMDAFRDFWEAESHVNDRTDQLPSTKWEIFEAVEYTKSGQSVGYKRGYARALEEVEKQVKERDDIACGDCGCYGYVVDEIITNLKAKGGRMSEYKNVEEWFNAEILEEVPFSFGEPGTKEHVNNVQWFTNALKRAWEQAERRGEERGAKAAFKAARCENVLNGIGEKDVMEILHYHGIEFTHPLFHIWFEDWRASEEYKKGGG